MHQQDGIMEPILYPVRNHVEQSISCISKVDLVTRDSTSQPVSEVNPQTNKRATYVENFTFNGPAVGNKAHQLPADSNARKVSFSVELSLDQVGTHTVLLNRIIRST